MTNSFSPGQQGSVDAAYQIVQRMAGDNGCAWHEEQTHESLTRYLVEETYELVDVIDDGANAPDMVNELADVLYQVLFHAAIAERDGEGYGLATIAGELSKKLVLRHPHVFGDRGYMSSSELKDEWEHLKEDAAGKNRGSREPLEGIPKDLPTLARAAKVIERLSRADLIVDPERSTNQTETEIGNELLNVVRNAMSLGIDPDTALRKAIKTFSFAAIAQDSSAKDSVIKDSVTRDSVKRELPSQVNTEMNN